MLFKVFRYFIPAILIYSFYFVFIALSTAEEVEHNPLPVPLKDIEEPGTPGREVYTMLNLSSGSQQLDVFMDSIKSFMPAASFQKITQVKNILEAYKTGDTPTRQFADKLWEDD